MYSILVFAVKSRFRQDYIDSYEGIDAKKSQVFISLTENCSFFNEDQTDYTTTLNL